MTQSGKSKNLRRASKKIAAKGNQSSELRMIIKRWSEIREKEMIRDSSIMIGTRAIKKLKKRRLEQKSLLISVEISVEECKTPLEQESLSTSIKTSAGERKNLDIQTIV